MNKISNLKLMCEELINKGYKGGIYYYKKGECSCCFGGDKTWLFQINGNKPDNWSGMCYKILYDITDKVLAEKFRKDANRIAKKYFAKLVVPAKNINQAIIINTVF